MFENNETGKGRANTDNDILSVLLRNTAVDDEGLVDQMLTFLAAGMLHYYSIYCFGS